jgi:hypothetical protein
LVLWVRAPLVPVIVSVEAPTAAEVDVVSVRVEVPEVLMEVGEKLAVTPVGNPVADSATVPVKPFDAETEAVNVVVCPAVTVCALGETDREKSGGGLFAVTVTFTEVLCVRDPLVPVMFSV